MLQHEFLRDVLMARQTPKDITQFVQSSVLSTNLIKSQKEQYKIYNTNSIKHVIQQIQSHLENAIQSDHSAHGLFEKNFNNAAYAQTCLNLVKRQIYNCKNINQNVFILPPLILCRPHDNFLYNFNPCILLISTCNVIVPVLHIQNLNHYSNYLFYINSLYRIDDINIIKPNQNMK